MKHKNLIVIIITFFLCAFTIMADSRNVELVGQMSGEINAVYTTGNFSYICAGIALIILDISNPSSNFEVGRYYISSPGWDIQVSGDYAYIVDGVGLHIIDISDPTNPEEVGFWGGLLDGIGIISGSVDLLAICISGSYAYVADWYNGLRVVDISIPSRPKEVGGVLLEGIIQGMFMYLGTMPIWLMKCLGFK